MRGTAALGLLAAASAAAGDLVPGAIYTVQLIGRPCASYLTGQPVCDHHRVFYADTVTADSYWQLLPGPGNTYQLKMSGGRGGRPASCGNNRMHLGVALTTSSGAPAACKRIVETFGANRFVTFEKFGALPNEYSIIPTSSATCRNRAISASACDVDDWAIASDPSEAPGFSVCRLTCVERCSTPAPPATPAPITWNDMCPPGWWGSVGSQWCYKVTAAAYKWATQDVGCSLLGALQGSSGGPMDEAAVRKALQEGGATRVWVPLMCGDTLSNPYSLSGCSDVGSPTGGWRWIDGLDYDHTRVGWAAGEPGKFPCGMYDGNTPVGFADKECWRNYPALCKVAARTASPVAPPTAAPVTGFPSRFPTSFPSRSPTESPTSFPTTLSPTANPTVGCNHPSIISLQAPVPVKETLIENATQLWLEDPAPLTYIDFPNDHGTLGAWLQGGRLFVLDSKAKCFPKGQTVNIECRSETCDVYVFIYHQPPTSGATNGGLTSTLPNDEWRPGGHCAPRFWYENDQACKYPMLVFRKQLDCRQSTEITLDDNKDAAYMAIAAVRGIDCSDNTYSPSMERCLTVPPGHGSTCRWEEGECRDKWCPPLQLTRSPAATAPPVCPPPDLAC